MPTERHGKVRRMLKCGLAKIVQLEPFTIRLNYESTNFTQSIDLGVDTGRSHIGISASSTDKEYYAADVSPRNDIVALLADRKYYRHNRRTRKIRHRKVKLHHTYKEGWLPPSIKHCVNTHLRLIHNVYRLLPISSTTIEIGQFDIARIQNDEITGKEYQLGDKYNFWNVREYIFYRDKHTCQYCHGKSKDNILNVHHLESRRTGGNAPNNLITLCETCHKKLHRGEITINIMRGDSFKATGCVNIMKWELYRRLKDIYTNIHVTHGFTTKNTRIRNHLKKTHINDARCISGHPQATQSKICYFIKQTRRHNRKIHKIKILKGGRLKLNQAPYIIKGFRLFDKVLYKGVKCFIYGRRSSGYFDLRMLDGEKVHTCASYKDLKLITPSKGFLIEAKNNESL